MKGAINVRFSRTTLFLASLFLLGLALRLYCLDCHGLWGDEVASIDGAQLGIPDIFTGRFGWVSNQTPFHYLLVWLTMQPVDPTTTTILVRLPSVLAGALTPLVLFGIGRELFGRAQGAFAALMLAMSAVHLNHSQEVRLYALMVFFTSLSVYALLMARRTGAWPWWALFATATVANVGNSYIALTIVIPTMSLYLGWLLWRLGSRIGTAVKPFLYATLSMGVVAVACVFMLLDSLRTPRPSPDLTRISISEMLGTIIALMKWFMRFGLPEQLEQWLQLGLLLLGVLGFYLAIRDRRASSAFLCALFIVVPPLLLDVFSTTNSVFQRYALFTMPFYFLLISNALVSGLAATYRSQLPGSRARLVRGMLAGAAASTLLVFILGAYRYNTPDGHIALAYRPDFRGVAQYLARQVTPRDTLVFVDAPDLGYTNSNFYWKGSPPAHAYDARDPRLFADKVEGDIYWIVSDEQLQVLSEISASDQAWADVASFERVVVLREKGPKTSIVESMDRLVSRWEAITPNYQPVIALRGSLYEAQGDVAKAADQYKLAGTYFPLGEDYLRTAMGFDSKGDTTKAWREACISKFLQPDMPHVHEWMAQKLLAAGYTTESHAEAAIAKALNGSAH